MYRTPFSIIKLITEKLNLEMDIEKHFEIFNYFLFHCIYEVFKSKSAKKC